MSKHDFKFIPQYKGKDLKKVSDKHRKDSYFSGIKYDGHYVQIHKFGDQVMFFTSGGKPFMLDDVEAELVKLNPNMDFIIETEHIGLTDGKLGSRGQCTTTTWFTNFEKLINCNAGKKQFKAFDLMYIGYNKPNGQGYVRYDCMLPEDNDNFELRSYYFEHYNIKLGDNISLVEFKEISFVEANKLADKLCVDGWEGLFGFHSSHTWHETNTSRSNLAIKFKAAPTVDLLCIDVKYSDINPEDIASLICINSKKQIVAAGHLKHELKGKEPDFFIGRIIEVKYESMGVNTYQQPRFSQFRDDKTKEEID